jgi:hypothetical protein
MKKAKIYSYSFIVVGLVTLLFILFNNGWNFNPITMNILNMLGYLLGISAIITGIIGIMN